MVAASHFSGLSPLLCFLFVYTRYSFIIAKLINYFMKLKKLTKLFRYGIASSIVFLVWPPLGSTADDSHFATPATFSPPWVFADAPITGDGDGRGDGAGDGAGDVGDGGDGGGDGDCP